MKTKKGLTLIQLIVVIVVLGILSVIAIPNIKNVVIEAKTAVKEENRQTVQKAVERYYLENEEYPSTNQPSSNKEEDIDLTKLVPDYLKEEPKKNILFSVKPTGEVEARYSVKNDITGNGTLSNPYVIHSIEGLNMVRNDLTANYVLGRDLDFNLDSSYLDPSNKGTYTTGTGWQPISTIAVEFEGNFDGQGYSISNLYINRPTEENVGLFGDIWHSSVKNVSLLNANVTGDNNVGILSGLSEFPKEITNIYTTGTVTGNTNIGGVIGHIWDFDNSLSRDYVDRLYSNANVTGFRWVGGLVGWSYEVDIKESYFNGFVEASANWDDFDGAIVGDLGVNSIIDNSNYFDTEISTQTIGHSAGAIDASATDNSTGLTSSQMKDNLNYTGWDFSSIWELGQDGYPQLKILNN